MPTEPIQYALVAAALAIAVGWRPFLSGGAPVSGPWTSALLPPIVFATALWAHRRQLLPFPPSEALHWLLWATVAAVPLAALEGRVVTWSLSFAALAGATVWLALGPVLERLEGARAPAWAAGAAGVLWLTGSSQRELARRRSEGPALALLWLLACAVGAAVQRRTYGGAGLLLGACCTGLGGLAVVATWRRGWSTLEGASAGLALYLGGLLALGIVLGETPIAPSVAALAIPLLAWLPGKGSRRALVWGLPAMALAAYAVWATWPPPDPYAAYR